MKKKISFLFWHDVLMDWIWSERLVSIEGALGGGKSLLAFMLAEELVKNKDYELRYVLSNCASTVTDSIDDIEIRKEKYVDAVIIFDELGKFVNKKNSFIGEELMSDLRKINCIMLNPSRNPTYEEIRKLVVEPQINLIKIGLDVIIYKAWLDRRDSKNKTYFAMIGTSRMKGYYDSDQMNSDSQGLIQWLMDIKTKIRDSNYVLNNTKIMYVS